MGPKRLGPNPPGPNPPDPVGTPDNYGVPPPRSLQVDDRWTIDHVMELQKTVATLTQGVATLSQQIKDQNTTFETICADVRAFKTGLKVVWWVGGIVAAACLFLIVRLWGPIMSVVAKIATAAAKP